MADNANASNAAVMFADISGSSALYQRQGDTQAKLILDRALAVMLGESQAHGGILVKTIGDEIMVRFDEPNDALLAASSIQNAFCQNPELATLAVRIGLDYGPVIFQEGDVFGAAVNDAACIAHIARANQCIIGSALYQALKLSSQNQCQEFDRITLKGHKAKTSLYRLSWAECSSTDNATTVMSLTDITQQLDKNRICIQYQGRDFSLTPEATPFKIGRDPDLAQLHVSTGLASREHCHIEYRRGKFILVDHSTNGTYVSVGNRPEIYLRREELPLAEQGSIGIGQTLKECDEKVHFTCEQQ